MINPHRYVVSDPSIDAREAEWWATFAEIEHEICWVQGRKEQRLLRGSYIRKIIRLTNPERPIVDLGCGTGWLSLLLAEHGAKEVIGLDFSPEQIARARKDLAERKPPGRVRFELADKTGADKDLIRSAGTVVMHAFLHHLSVTEIKTLFQELKKDLAEDALVILLEPALDPSLVNNFWNRKASEAVYIPLNFWHRIRRRFLPRSDEEKKIVKQVNSRQWGERPRGVSPKEIPFYPGELEEYLGDDYVVEEKKAVFSFSRHYTAQMILMSKTHPGWAKVFYYPFVIFGKVLESLYLFFFRQSGSIWIFNMWVIRPRHKAE